MKSLSELLEDQAEENYWAEERRRHNQEMFPPHTFSCAMRTRGAMCDCGSADGMTKR